MRSEVKALTGLRGVAACIVAVAHLDFMHWAPFKFLAFHNLAVDLFFCLSAFTLCLVYKPLERHRLELRAYGVARFARIYPLYLFTLLLAAATFIRWGTGDFNAYPGSAMLDFIRQLFMLNALPIIGNGVHWNLPSWSLSVEAFCYIAVFPVLFWGSKRAAKWPEWARTSLLLLLSAAAYYMFARHFNWRILDPGTHSDDALVYWTAIVRAVCSFSAGWLIYIAWRNEESLPRFAATNADSLTIAVCLVLVGKYLGAVPEVMLVFVWPLLVVGLMNGASWTARVLSCRPVVWLGHLSYSIYLCHMLVWHITMKLFPAISTSQPLRLVVQVGGTLFMACATYYLLERPARTAIRKVFIRNSASSPMLPASAGPASP
ncbi:MAG TPA: acyltransferase [Bordetella sp.]|nr:acyltransferase [Bordetella sp.]